jgi:hypothetical protein
MIKKKNIKRCFCAKMLLFVAGSMALASNVAWSQSNYQFKEVAARSGVLNEAHAEHFGSSWVDYDNDGLMDLYIINCEENGVVGEPPTGTGDNTLYRNQGNGRFIDITDETGTGDPWCAMRNVFADYDADGDQDLYSHNFIQSTLYRNDNGIYINANEETGAGLTFSRGTGASWGDYDNDGWLDLHAVNFPFGEQALLKNNGDGTFTNITQASGLPDMASAMGNMFGDFDNDGDLDIASAAVSSEDIQYLYQNNGDGTFTDISQQAGIVAEPGSSGSAIVWADYNNDLWLDLLLTEVSLGAVEPKGTELPNRVYLFENNRDGTFTDVTEEAGLLTARFGESYWDAGFADQNSDGILDLYIAVDGGNNLFYRGDARGKFTEVGGRLRVDLEGSGKGLAWADYDNDGDIDLHTVIFKPAKRGDPNPTLLFNNSGGRNHWLQVELAGIASNLDGIGAKIIVSSPDGKQQLREISGGRGFFAQDSPIQHFGLGRSTSISVVVEWPSGRIDTIKRVAADQRITVIEGMGRLP